MRIERKPLVRKEAAAFDEPLYISISSPVRWGQIAKIRYKVTQTVAVFRIQFAYAIFAQRIAATPS